MASRKSNFGPNFTKVIENTPCSVLRGFLANQRTPDDSLIQPPVLPNNVSDDEGREILVAFLTSQDRDVLLELDSICVSLLEMSEAKGRTSLETVAGNKLNNVEFAVFEDQQDPLLKSIWTHIRFPDVFRDAESFYAARRYREHRRMYAAFEVDQEVGVDVHAEGIDKEDLCQLLDQKLLLRAKSSASIIDLPETPDHPPSVMVALRHPGALSSIQNHHLDGKWDKFYYRPSNEAVLIYTPRLKKIEVCAESFDVRTKVSDLFAEVVLGQNLSEKPLTRCNFNTERFRKSFDLPPPDFDDVEITMSTVVEVEMPLGNWGRRLNLKITKDDSVERVMSAYLRDPTNLVRKFGFSKIAIAVGYVRKADRKAGTFRIAISSGNSSNVQSQNDPFLRNLGQRLLTSWGLLDVLKPLTDSDKARWFHFLLSLYDLPGEEVSGAFFLAAGVNSKSFLDGGVIERKPRQVLVLVDDKDDVIEGELSTGRTTDVVTREGSFGESQGNGPASEGLIYRIHRSWLAEMVLKSVSDAIASRSIELVDEHLAVLGKLELGQASVPVYLARNLGDPKVLNGLDIVFRQRQKTGVGIVFAASENPPRFLGPNVVMPLAHYIVQNDEAVRLDLEMLTLAFTAGRSLVSSAQIAQVIRGATQTATLILPGEEPLHLDGAHQIRVFEQLVEASNNGSVEVRSKVLTEGMGSSSPQQLFSQGRWKLIDGVYISQGSSNRFWRLGGPRT